MNIENIAIKDIQPYERNAKKHDERQVKNVMESIKQFGIAQPLVIDKNNVLIIGHCRLTACKRLKMTTVPVVRMDELSQEQVDKLRLLDNKLNESEWDFDLLAEDIPELDFSDFDLDWELPELEDEAPNIIEDEVPEPPQEAKAKVGDLYELGWHRLVCGDSTNPDVIDKLLNGVKAQLLLTDPPYGVKAVESGGHNDGKKAGHQMARDNIYAPIIGDDTTDSAKSCYNIALKTSENQIIFGGNYFTDFLPPSRCWIVWDKKAAGTFADGELAWTSFDRNLKIYEFMWSGMRRQGDRTVEGATRVHPTQKPVGMIGGILRDFSTENDIILDCFGGSGSTLIACEQMNRKCYMCELEPHYIDVIVQRYINLKGTSENVFLIRDGQKIAYDDIK